MARWFVEIILVRASTPIGWTQVMEIEAPDADEARREGDRRWRASGQYMNVLQEYQPVQDGDVPWINCFDPEDWRDELARRTRREQRKA